MFEDIKRLISNTGYTLGRDFELEISKDAQGVVNAKITCLISGISKTYSPIPQPFLFTSYALDEIRKDFSNEKKICEVFQKEPRKVKIYKLSPIQSKFNNQVCKNIPLFHYVVVP